MKDLQCERYIENLRKVRALSKPEFEQGTDAQTILDTIQKNATESFLVMKENNRILNERVFSRKAAELTDEDIEALYEFAGKLFAYMNSEDDGIAYKVHCLLLEAARLRGDAPFIIRELYNCGVTLYYLNLKSDRMGVNTFGARVRAYFQEGADYISRYEEFDTKTRDCIIRCLGNSKMALSRRSHDACRVYMRLSERALAVMTDPYYQNLNPEIPWGNLIYGIHIDRFVILAYLRENDDPEIAEKVYRSAKYVYEKCGENQGEEARLQNWRVNFFYAAAKYHAGRGTARSLVESALDAVERVDHEDFTSTGINNNLGLTTYMYRYVGFLDSKDREKLENRIQRSKRCCLEYLNKLPLTRYPRVLNRVLQDLVETLPMVESSGIRGMLDYILAAHRPTYVHSLMVALLAKHFIGQLIKKNPESLIGLMGYQTTEELRAHADEITEMAYKCGLYHDLGKSAVIMYIGMNARRLLDEEFECIQCHPAVGYETLSQIGRGDDLGQAALFHHRFYDETGGYPKGYGNCNAEMKAIVDVLNVADSLDAATDNIGRCYTMAKSVDDLVSEFRAQKGTRYAPYVVALFDDPGFTSNLKAHLDERRKRIYLKVYDVPPPPIVGKNHKKAAAKHTAIER